MERDDADGVPGLFDPPPPAKPAGARGAAEGGPSPTWYPPHSQPATHPMPFAPPAPLEKCLIPVLLPYPSHQEVPSTGELEAIDKAHLRRGRDKAVRCENRSLTTAPASQSKAQPGLNPCSASCHLGRRSTPQGLSIRLCEMGKVERRPHREFVGMEETVYAKQGLAPGPGSGDSVTITIDPSPELSLEVTDRSCHSALGCTKSTHPSLAFSLAPVMQNPSQGQALHAFAHTSLPCIPVTRTGPRTRRGVEAGKGEEERRVPAGPVLEAGARKRSHSWPCSEEPPSGRKTL